MNVLIASQSHANSLEGWMGWTMGINICAVDIYIVCQFCFRMQAMGLNTYMYAPKDDYKHRAFWRELYSVEEAGKLSLFLFSSNFLHLSHLPV